MNFPVDSYTTGMQFFNVTASVQKDHIWMSGAYQASDLIPVLLFSVGIPWIEPCVRHVCCLWDVALRYKDHDLMTALGPTCNQDANFTGVDLMKGNPIGPKWSVETMIHPSFVAMLFLSTAPMFYMYYQILPLQWIDTSTVNWRASWYGQPCHHVTYPNGQRVCIACFNSKPDNAVFVFSASWFSTFQCKWVCKPGYTGPNCEVTIDLAIYASGSLVAALFIAGMVVCMIEQRRRQKRPPVEEAVIKQQPSKVIIPPIQAPPPRQVHKTGADMITFKDPTSEIRIKLL
jgi:hypothetical protein